MIGDLLERGIVEVIEKKSLEGKLSSGKKLRIKFGIDPTAPDVHLGHGVPIRKLAKFQLLGHKVIYIVGDYTATIGDPSGKTKTRETLSKAVVRDYAKKYFTQAFKILDPQKTEVHYQSEWFGDFTLYQLIELTSKVTVEQLLEHETFRVRIKKQQPFALHEMIYPILQGYDSVAVKADVEIGGMDQKFNLLMGRQIQKAFDQPPQDVIMMDYLLGTEGKEKMSKSLGNYISFLDDSTEMFGKVMSIPDKLVPKYWELCTDLDMNELKKSLDQNIHLRDLKTRLALEIVAQFHSREKALESEREFNRIFRDKELPSRVPQKKVEIRVWRLSNLLVEINLAESKSEAKRLIEQRGVRVDGSVIEDPEARFKVYVGMILAVGKRKYIQIV